MSNADRGTPEQELLLWVANRAMEAYRGKHGRYSDEWSSLDIKFALPSYRPTDTDIRPKQDSGNTWTPRGCKLTYVIREATANTFLIQAVSDTGFVEYELRQGMERPRLVSPIAPLFLSCAPTSDGYDQGDERARRIGKDPSLSFKSSFRVTDAELVLSYQVENRSARDAYLFTGVWHQSYIADPNIIYVHQERDTKTLWLNKRIPAIPSGLKPMEPACPVQTPLRAGTTFREEVHVPLPAKELRAYNERSDRPRSPPAVVPYDGVRFTLQYYWRTEGMVEETKMLDGRPVLVTHGGAPLKESDHGFLESDRVSLRVPVMLDFPYWGRD